MPELPEVEVVRRGLARWVVGRRIEAVEVLHPRPVRRHVPVPPTSRPACAASRSPTRCDAASSCGSTLDSGEALLAHLGMSGQLLLQPEPAPAERHLRARFGFDDDGPGLRFVDQRMFGGLWLASWSPAPTAAPAARAAPRTRRPRAAPRLPEGVGHIARDALDPALDEPALVERVRRRRTGVKRALLDQTLVSGVGNIYADEALWRSRLHYARPTDTLTRPAVRRLLADVRVVMTDALAQGGTSFDSLYVDVNGRSAATSTGPCPCTGAAAGRAPGAARSSCATPS